MGDSCKEVIKKLQCLRNCGHFLADDFFAFPNCITNQTYFSDIFKKIYQEHIVLNLEEKVSAQDF